MEPKIGVLFLSNETSEIQILEKDFRFFSCFISDGKLVSSALSSSNKVICKFLADLTLSEIEIFLKSEESFKSALVSGVKNSWKITPPNEEEQIQSYFSKMAQRAGSEIVSLLQAFDIIGCRELYQGFLHFKSFEINQVLKNLKEAPLDEAVLEARKMLGITSDKLSESDLIQVMKENRWLSGQTRPPGKDLEPFWNFRDIMDLELVPLSSLNFF